MVQVLNAPPKPFSWSFSAVDNFETCALKYYHQNIAKDVSDKTTYRTQGDEVHNLMADALRGKPLPFHVKHWQRWIDEFDDGMPVFAERKLAFTEKGEPCDFFDKKKKPWCRIAIDALKFRNYCAVMLDWKTGQVKVNDDQLLLYALGLFMHYPKVHDVDASFIFLKEDTGPHIPRSDCVYQLRITRKDTQEWWPDYLARVRKLEHAVRTNEFIPRRNGLCRAHCPVHTCEYNGRFECP